MLLCVLWCFSSSLYRSVGVFSVGNGTKPLTLSSRCCLCRSLQKWLQVLPGLLHFRATTAMSRHEPQHMRFTSLTAPDKISHQGCTGPGGLCTLHRGGASPTHSSRGACPCCQHAPAPCSQDVVGDPAEFPGVGVQGGMSDPERGPEKSLKDVFVSLVTWVVYFQRWLFLPCS